MKYVIFQNKLSARFAVLFADAVTHSDVRVEGHEPVSAGFVDPRSGFCWGSSVSLKLKADPVRDEPFVIATLLNNSVELNLLNAERLVS